MASLPLGGAGGGFHFSLFTLHFSLFTFMSRLFHAKIQFQSWFLLLAILFVFVYSAWHRQPIFMLITLALLILMIDRMIHTTYTITPTDIIIHTGKFSKDKAIPLQNLLRVEKISGLRLFGHSFNSFLLLTYQENGSEKSQAVIPQNFDDFVKCLQKRKQK